MKLCVFLATANNITLVKIYNAWKENELIYDGTYSEFSHAIHELNLGNATVCSWKVEDETVIIEIDLEG